MRRGVGGLAGGVLQTTGAGRDVSACSCLAVRLMCVGHVLHMPTAIKRPRVGPQAGALGRLPASFNQPALPGLRQLACSSRDIQTAAIPNCTKHDTMAATNDMSGHSLDSLEARLQRISYALHGDQENEDASTPPRLGNTTPASRLRNLEHQMQTLASKSSTVDHVLQLQSRHPDIFNQAHNAEQPNTLPLPSQAALVLSHAQLYSRISGQLQSLQETSVPDPTSASKLRELQPRINKAAARQEQQAIELAELRSRSAAAVEKWYETGVLGMAERWAEWEERMRDVEIVVRRLEAVKKREEELV